MFVFDGLPEHSIPVVFDVAASDRRTAAIIIATRLSTVHNSLVGRAAGRATVESWWFPEAQDKHADENDRDAMTLRDAYDAGDPEFPANARNVIRECIAEARRNTEQNDALSEADVAADIVRRLSFVYGF